MKSKCFELRAQKISKKLRSAAAVCFVKQIRTPRSRILYSAKEIPRARAPPFHPLHSPHFATRSTLAGGAAASAQALPPPPPPPGLIFVGWSKGTGAADADADAPPVAEVVKNSAER